MDGKNATSSPTFVNNAIPHKNIILVKLKVWPYEQVANHISLHVEP